ncbi:hypothetical protein K1X76_10740, partial [bacterium]|nr:hypothetical protein [bacterium]
MKIKELPPKKALSCQPPKRKFVKKLRAQPRLFSYSAGPTIFYMSSPVGQIHQPIFFTSGLKIKKTNPLGFLSE